MSPFDTAVHAAATAIREAEVLLVGAGAGMGVDSGLPDFRGDHGFWKAYPPYEALGLTFMDAANPEHFRADPPFGWGFYGHRLGLYRTTVPHGGFAILRRWAEARRMPSFVFTSNVDGQFQKAGFDPVRIVEVHGSIHHLQFREPCSIDIWDAREEVEVDLATMRSGSVPRCPRCRGVARPNILMFGDFGWLHERAREQEERFVAFLEAQRGRRIAIVELGAGKAIPSVRMKSEHLARGPRAVLVRINPREADGPAGTISIAAGTLEGLQAIDGALAGR